MQPLRNAIAGQVRQMMGTKRSTPLPPRPPGDDGLFGPGSIGWKVHGDFPAMMIGGVSALLLQMLHPAALAGVWDHSNFRRDMTGRLRRTAQFIAGTTFGSTEHAHQLIDRVRRIHDRVDGTLLDGTPYFANDPAVLTWVHATGARSFLDAYVRYREPWLSRAAQDRYFAESAVVARLLGAGDVPDTRRDIDAYIEATRPALVADARTLEVTRILLSHPAPNPMIAPINRVMLDAGVDLLPRWAADMQGLGIPAHRKPLVRAGGSGLATVLRWALSAKAAAGAS
ncbi:DUF2236 domain-containing protein [Sphingosinicellaceae bacterium]|nr:DUF2236 domain-containing protein [Sphingosinicellaceae bacterium]